MTATRAQQSRSPKAKVLAFYPEAYLYFDGVGTGRRWFVKGHHKTRPSIYGTGRTAHAAWSDAFGSVVAAHSQRPKSFNRRPK